MGQIITTPPRNGHATKTFWTVLGGLVLAMSLWFSRAAADVVAFGWSLGDRVPRLENRVELLEQRVMEEDRALMEWRAMAEEARTLRALLEQERKDRQRRKR